MALAKFEIKGLSCNIYLPESGRAVRVIDGQK